MSHFNMPPIFKSHVHDPSTMDVWDPFSDKNKEHHLLRRPHNIIPLAHNPMIINKRLPQPAEWKETSEAHVLTVEVPGGLNKDEVKVRIEDDVLKISGQKEVVKEERHESWQQFERSKGRFFQAVSLPANSRSQDVRYTVNDGVLTVTVPKKDAKKLHAKTIHVQG